MHGKHLSHFENMLKQDCLSIEGRPPATNIHRHASCSCDLDLDPITLIHKHDLDSMT